MSTDPIEPFAAPLRACSDEELLGKLAALPPLADETDPCWDDMGYWDDPVGPYLALARLTGERQLRAAVSLLLARASYGDPGETMRGLRHDFERAFASDGRALADVCLAAIETGRLGSVLWAVHQLIRLEDPRARPVLRLWARSTDERISDVAKIALGRIERPLR